MASNSQTKTTSGILARSHLLVAAIDFGSTFSGYAFSLRSDYQVNPLKIYTNNWASEKSGGISYKAPTTVLLNPDQSFHSFGYDAEDKYAELTEKDEHKDWYYFSRFKMKLMNALDISKDQHGNKNLFKDIQRDMCIKDIDNKEVPVKTIISYAIQFLKSHMEQHLKEKNIVDVFVKGSIFWVITVPAIWTDAAKQITREAACQAGIDDDQLMLAYEPEAAALYCRLLPINKFVIGGKHQELILKTFEKGQKFIVIDLGGGTVDISLQETTIDFKMKTIHKVCGGPWGGSNVDEAFMQFLFKLVGADVFTQFKRECRSDYLELLRNFELKKRSTDDDSEGSIVLRVPPSLFEILEEVTGCSISEMIKSSAFSDSVKCSADKMLISKTELQSFFKNSVESIISNVRGILNEPVCKNLSGVLLVGGFADSPFVKNSIKKAFPDIKFIVPMEAGLAIAKGAVLFGHDPYVICARVCRYTYGIEICYPFIPELDPIEKHTTFEKCSYCKNRFQIAYVIGSLVDIGNVQTLTSQFNFVDEHRQHKRYKPISVSVYISDKPKPRYIDEKGCKFLGKIKIQCRNEDNIWPSKFTCSVDMTVASTEIIVTAKLETGETASASFDFLSS